MNPFPDVAMADNGNFAISYTRDHGVCGSDYNVLVVVKRFASNGTPLGPELIVDSIHCIRELNLSTTIVSVSDFNLLVTVSDAVYLINYIFAGGQAPVVQCIGDANGDGVVRIADAVTVINPIFAGATITGSCV